MLTQDQLNREAHHRLSQARAAFHWRARAEKAAKGRAHHDHGDGNANDGDNRRGLRIPRST